MGLRQNQRRARRVWRTRLLSVIGAASVCIGSAVAIVPMRAGAAGVVSGGSNFNNIVLELPQGAQVNDIYEMSLTNQSSDVVTAEFQWSAPYGIVLTAAKKDFTVLPGGKASAPFNISVQDDTPGGEYLVSTGLFRRDVKANPDEVVFVPGVTQNFTIKVIGDAANARVRVVDTYKKEPISGLVSVARVTGSVRTEIARQPTAELNLRAVPGTYEASVFLDGRRVATKQFSLKKDEFQDVLIEVQAIFLREVSLLPRKTSGKLVNIEVTTTVENSMRALPNATLVVEVLRSGKQLETVEMQKFSPLELGPTSASVRYVPKDGWKPGRYTFVARLEAPEFTVKAASEPSYSVGGSVASRFGLALGGAGLGALAIAAVAALLIRKRRAKAAGARKIPERNRPARDTARTQKH